MIIPFGSSMNIFLNALAVEMNSDMNNDDYSQRYERFYKDDSFREAYYNYHKQHHQLEQQQQHTSYNNDYSYDSDYEPDYSSYTLDYEPEYNSDGKDNSYYKSKDSSNVIVKKIKCNNINVNVNGFNGVELGTLPTALNGLTTEAQAADEGEGEVGASSSRNGGGSDGGRPSGSDTDSRICINNNDFNVADRGTTPQPPEPRTCEECFTILSETQLDDLFPIIEPVFQGLVIETLEGLCNLFEDLTSDHDKERLYIIMSDALRSTATITLEETTTILDCLIKLGLIIEPISP